MAVQLIADLYDCSEMIDDVEAIKAAAHKAVEYVGAHIVEECVHKFEPVGITYFAIISNSHFSIHTWPEHRYAAVDIFSCKEEVTDGIAQMLKDLFGAGRIRFRTIQRNIEEPSEGE
ncbi:MAG: adenosylmethionine decarboxylase [Bacteroidales bacterium]|nr:adenosylmethionine decarboxylase [Lachnoclostridium sp.]MCM1383548.1 adenosylmethionine decarboxylase [Lachnoclostridium sp.]MCM1464169.1 adenosylmethionine decarboxylase [Bacteroidales bacterium]